MKQRTGISPLPAAVRWVRGALAGGLLLAEYILLTVAFDADAARNLGGWWNGVALLDPLGAIGLVVLGAAAMLFISSRPRAVGAEARSFADEPRLAPPLLVHAAIFLSFAAVSAHLFGGDETATASLARWVIPWAALAVGVLASAIAIAVPLGSLGTLLLRWRQPILLGLAIGGGAWSLGRWTRELWQPLSSLTLRGTVFLLKLAGQQVVSQMETRNLAIGDFSVDIAPSCSGLEGIGVVVVFLGAFLWAERDDLRFPRAWLLVPIGIGLVWIANTVRLAALMLIGRWISPEVALGGFHSKAGWVLYCSVAVGVAALAKRSASLSRAEATVDEHTWNPTAIYLLPLLALLATTLVSGLAQVDFDDLYFLRPLAVGAVLWAGRDSSPLRLVAPSWEAVVLGLVVAALWLVLEPSPDSQQVAAWQQHLSSMPAWARIGWIASRLVGSVLAVPIAEELAFRGYLLRRLISADFTALPSTSFTWSAVLLSSVAFGALHQRWLAGTLAGLCFAAAQLRHGRLEDAAAAHLVANAVIAAAVLGLGWTWLWT